VPFYFPTPTPSHQRCAVCGSPVEREEAGADVRLYLGPGDKLAELWLPLCSTHVERFVQAHNQEIVECRVASVDRGRPGLEAQR
jgi:hypothetical protein